MNYDYNTSREKLILPEYGRNIQKMINYVVSIEDREERNKAAQTVIQIMGNLNPHLRDISDFKHKLWDHLAIVSDFKLDIDSPYETPAREVLFEKPNKVEYNQKNMGYKHYGRSLEMMIQKVAEMEDDEEKERLTELLANHMKKLYLTWNREIVDDKLIFDDLKELSKGKIEKAPDDLKLSETKDILQKNKRKRQPRRNK